MDETVFCKACESGDITTAKGLLRHVDASSLEQWRTSEDRTCLHVAVLAGDPDLLQELAATLSATLKELIKKMDNQGDTALHLAVRKYRVDLVRQLLELAAHLKAELCECENKDGETPLQMAVRLGFVEAVELLIKARKSNALQIQNDFLFHLVVGRNQVKLVKFLIESLKENKEDLSKLVNQPYRPATDPPDNKGKCATNPQHVQPIDAVDEHRKEQKQGPTNASGDGGDKPSQSAARNKNKADEERPRVEGDTPLHIAARNKYDEHNGGEQHPKEKVTTNESGVGGDKHSQSAARNKNKADEERSGVEGDTPLHIAARNKYDEMLGLLLTVDKVNKNARNDDGKTALDIAREVTEYHESLGIIKMLTDYPPKCRPFMYCAPQVSRQKHKKATEKINEAFRDRREAELVVAALLATMTFTGALALPGSFKTDGEPKVELGSPILISYVSFKLFLIFDCVAFFISLLVCIMWEMSSALTTGDKMLFMTVNGLLVCCSFGFTAYGFMAAVYAMLAHKVETFAWVVLGSLIFITLCGIVAFMHQFAIFAVGRARFHRLYGVSRLLDDIVEKVWNLSERLGLLHILRGAAKLLFGLIAGDIGPLKKFSGGQNDNGQGGGGSGGQNDNGHGGGGSRGQNEGEHEHSNNCSRSSSPFLHPSNV